MRGLELRLLGGFALKNDAGETIQISSRKSRALLAYLALSNGRAQSRERLAALLWADSNEAQARTSLRQALSALRKSLDDQAQILDAGLEVVTLIPETVWVDAVAFDEGVKAGGHEELARSLEWYEGDLLDGLSTDAPAFEQWIVAERERLRGNAVSGYARLCTYFQEIGDPEQARQAATRLLALDPVREDAHRQLMRLYLVQGRTVEAIKQYQLCRQSLARELGVVPTPETEALYREIVEGRKRVPVLETEVEDKPKPSAPNVSVATSSPVLRPATVLFSDLYRFTTFAGETDPEEVHEYLLRYRACVSEQAKLFGGVVTNFIGARMMAVFGVPVVHEDDAKRAAQAALAIREQVSTLETNSGRKHQTMMGLAGGSVLVEESAGQFLVSGEPVSMGARVMEQAHAGEILADGATHDALAERVQARARPDIVIQSAARPVAIWALESFRTGGPSLLPFAGRRAELAQASGVLDATLTSRAPHVLLIRGEAGIGKTRLLEQVIELGKTRGFLWHRMLVLDFGSGTGAGPIPGLLQVLLGVGKTPAEGARSIERYVEEGVLKPELRAAAYDLLEIDPPEALVGASLNSDSKMRQQARLAVIRLLTAFRGREAPLLLAVEDVHWADSTTLDLLARLVASARGFPAVLAMTTRPESDPINTQWRHVASGVPFLTLDLAPLSAEEARKMASHYSCPDPGVVESCLRRAGGNPLFLDQLLRGAGSASDALPGSVRSIVTARVDSLAEADRNTLQAASVLGQRFSVGALEHLTDTQNLSCETLLERGLLRTEGDDYLFSHALIQEAVYQSLMRSRRRALHLRAAQWYAGRDPSLHAEQMEAAEAPGAAQAYLHAANTESEHGRWERALRLAQRGLAIAHEPRIRHALLCRIGDAQRDTGEIDSSVQTFKAALELAESSQDKARTWYGMAAGLRILDRHNEALHAVGIAEDEARERDDPAELAKIYVLRGNLYFPLGQIEACLSAHEQARVQSERAGSPILQALALSGIGDANYLRGHVLSAQDNFSQCLQLARTHGLRSVEAGNLPMLAACQIYAMHYAEGVRLYDDSVTLARDLGNLRAEIVGHSVGSLLHLAQGNWGQAKGSAEQILALAQRLGARRFESEAKGLLGLVAWSVNELDQAEDLIDEAVAIAREAGIHYSGPWALGALALVTRNQDKREAAIREGERLLDTGCVSHANFHFRECAIQNALNHRQWDEAQRHAKALAAYTSQEPLPWTEFIVTRGQVLARIGKGERGPAVREQLSVLLETAQRTRSEFARAELSKAQARLES